MPKPTPFHRFLVPLRCIFGGDNRNTYTRHHTTKNAWAPRSAIEQAIDYALVEVLIRSPIPCSNSISDVQPNSFAHFVASSAYRLSCPKSVPRHVRSLAAAYCAPPRRPHCSHDSLRQPLCSSAHRYPKRCKSRPSGRARRSPKSRDKRLPHGAIPARFLPCHTTATPRRPGRIGSCRE